MTSLGATIATASKTTGVTYDNKTTVTFGANTQYWKGFSWLVSIGSYPAIGAGWVNARFYVDSVTGAATLGAIDSNSAAQVQTANGMVVQAPNLQLVWTNTTSLTAGQSYTMLGYGGGGTPVPVALQTGYIAFRGNFNANIYATVKLSALYWYEYATGISYLLYDGEAPTRSNYAMPKPTADQVVTQQNRRIFIQYGGPSASNAVSYAGQDAQYMMLSGVTRPVRGSIEPIRVYDPKRAKSFKVVGRKTTAPDFPTATLTLLENRGALPFQLGDLTCPFNLYLPVGACRDMSDFLNGWSDFVEIVSYAEATEVDEGDRMSWEEDNQTEDAISITLQTKYAIGGLGFAAQADGDITRQVVDVVYGSTLRCGDCGPSDDGTKWIYAVTDTSGAGSPGMPAELIYTTNSGLTWTQTTITSFGATESPVAIDIVGDKLVIVGEDALYWATINNNTGVPGTFTKVTSGFVALGSPRDIYVLSPREVWFCGDAGYIYKSSDITSGVTVISAGSVVVGDLKRIHGDGENTIVAAGGNSDIAISVNRGETFSATVTEPEPAATIQALWVSDENNYWVGTSTGNIWYTVNGGETWTQKEFTSDGAGSVRDIVFATDEVGYFVHSDATPTGYLWATWNGGADWVRNDGQSNRILNWPTLDYINRVAVPLGAGVQTRANNLVAGGLAGDGTDGILLLGEAVEL